MPVQIYLLRRLLIDRRNQVCAMDITYIPIEGGLTWVRRWGCSSVRKRKGKSLR